MLVKGNVSSVDSKKRIFLNDTYAIPWNYKGNQNEPLKKLVGSGGSGVQMEDGTLVFPLEGTKKKTNQGDGNEKDGKTVSLILHSKDTKFWTLSKGMSDGGCSVPSVVEWEKDKLMMMTACDDGRRRVYESGDKGDSWTEALGTLPRVWGNKKGKDVKIVGSGFITAKIIGDGDDRKNVMLVTLPVYSGKKGNEVNEKEKEKGELHLWLSDNTHIADIGPVSGKEEDVAASSLLYKSAESGDNNEEKLIALYEKKESGDDTSHGMVSVRLTEQLQRVKKVLATWKEVDERVSKLCATLLAQEDTSPDNHCRSTLKITDGLVGFLSGNFSENTWRDEYLGVNATVNNKGGAAKAEDGVTFRGAWAEWPVGRQGENQLYHFANYNFTLVAMVSVHKVPKEDNSIPLLGAKMTGAGNSVFLGLSYGKEKKWQLLSGDETPKEHSSTLRTEKTQHVVILLRNGTHGSAYVDGKRVGSASWNLDNTDSKEISHFYIGGDGGSAVSTGNGEGASVTVTNVLLYNRPLNDAEITALNANKISIPKTMAGDTSSSAVSRPNRPAEHLAEGAKGEGTARDGGAHGDAGTVWGSRLLPSLLLLLGLWGFAAL
ncbi:hypothetical protein ECC02_008229 [Trypanosoma cruzi]|uniref:Uncharacterized protein n=1 Tax=Trypanosoma cruzi TaxID=5693 RepID=A0A7J6XY49_TRYCR|nr:hypothetical protein ECC02_008229 [Trypanosoma cruzi]